MLLAWAAGTPYGAWAAAAATGSAKAAPPSSIGMIALGSCASGMAWGGIAIDMLPKWAKGGISGNS